MLKEIGTPARGSLRQLRSPARQEKQTRLPPAGFGCIVGDTRWKDPHATVLGCFACSSSMSAGLRRSTESRSSRWDCGQANDYKERAFANVDFYSGIIYDKMGIEVDLLPLFAMARVSGWLARGWNNCGKTNSTGPSDLFRGDMTGITCRSIGNKPTANYSGATDEPPYDHGRNHQRYRQQCVEMNSTW